MKKLIFTLIFPLFVWGQGAQLPKYKVSTLPTASLYPTYVVQVTDGLTAIDCTSGGGTFNVLCTSHGGAWNSVAQASGTTTNALTMNNSGSGAASGTTFNGSAVQTISYNTIGAAGISGTPTTGHCTQWASANTLSDAGSACGSGGSGTPGTPAGTVQVYKTSSTFGGTNNWVFEAGVNGAVCDDATDDTSAFNTLLSTVNTAGGGIITIYGTCLFSGQVTLPNSGGSTAIQSTIRITGGGNSGDASPSPAFHGPSVMDLRFNASNAKILTLGLGRFELDHLTLKDGGSDCASFVMTTSTIVSIHDVQFTGTASGTSACNDAIILGGTTTTYATNSTTAAFEGYGSTIDKNTFDNIRRGVWLKVFAQAVPVTNNTWHATCGSANTAAALEVGYAVSGSAVGTTDGNTFSGNYFETTNYPYVVWVHSSFNQFKNEDFWDASGTTLFAYHFTDRGLTAGLNTAMIGADATFFIGTNLSDANAPGSSNSVSEQIIQASMGLAAIQNRICNDTSGSGTAQTCNTGIPFTPVAGSLILYHTTTNNSGTGLTINVNSLGAKSVAKWQKITTLASGDVQSGTYIQMVYDGTNWVMQAPGNAPSGSGLSGMTSGQVPIAATATTVTSSKAIQGTDTNLMSSGTISGTGATLCTDANGGATTSGCPAGSVGAMVNITGSGQITATNCTQSASTGGYCSISGTTTTSVTFSVIPGTYLGLHTVIYGQGSAALNVQVTFNSDSGSHYSLVGYFQSGASAPGANSAATQTFCAGSGLTTGNVSAIISDVPFYADTSFAKVIETHGGEMASTGTSSSNFDLGTSCSWDNGGTPAAITSVTYTASTGHFVAGTKFIIYGVN